MHGTRNLGMQGSLRCGSRDLVAKYPSEYMLAVRSCRHDPCQLHDTRLRRAAADATDPNPLPRPRALNDAPGSEARAARGTTTADSTSASRA